MQMQPTVYLRRVRDFGEKISDALLFLKENWKRLFTLYLVFVVPFILIACIAGYFFAGHMIALFKTGAENIHAGDIFNPEFFVVMLCLVFAGSGYSTVIYAYVRIYDQQERFQASVPEVAQLVMKKFFPVMLYMILATLTMAVAITIPMILLIFIPGLNILALLGAGVVFVVFALNLNCLYVMEDVGFSRGIVRMFELLKNRWWQTIGYSIVVFMIYYFFAAVIQLVAMMIMGAASISFLSPNTFQGRGSSSNLAGTLVIVMGLMILLQQIFYIIIFCGVSVNYFSLAEEKDGSALEQQIDSIGTVNDKYGGIEETF